VGKARFALIALAVAVFCGCVASRPSGVPEYYGGNSQAARSIFEQDLAAEKNSRALYLLRLGTLDLDQGNIDAARESFIEATGIMQNFKADGEFKAMVGEEASKEYKGDPYEQMMALWYLGLLDYMFGEYDKALPGFKSAALADGGTRDERYRSDAASVFLMMARTYSALGDRAKAEEEYREAAGVYTFRQTLESLSAALNSVASGIIDGAKEPEAAQAAYELLSEGASAGASREQSPSAALAAATDFAFERLQKAAKSRSDEYLLHGQDPNIISGYIKDLSSAADRALSDDSFSAASSPIAAAISNLSDPSANLLIVVAVGRGPFKYRAGEYGELAKIGKSDSPAGDASVFVDGRPSGVARTVEDIYYQASTRGGRAMDSILAGRAVFKTVTKVGAAVAFAEAATTSSSKRRNQALVAGAVLAVVSAATRPEADVRSWETLPDRIQMLALTLPPGIHNVTVDFPGGCSSKFYNVEIKAGAETVIYARSTGGAWAVAPRNRL